MSSIGRRTSAVEHTEVFKWDGKRVNEILNDSACVTNIMTLLTNNSSVCDVSGCWLWNRATDTAGYAMLTVRGTQHRGHRLSYVLYKGEIPPSLFVRHLCHTRRCVNPGHLSVGTHQDNMDDMFRAGRDARPPLLAGEKNGNAKLTWTQARDIRQIYSEGQHSLSALAKLFGVSKKLILNIVRGRAWKEEHSI